MVYVSKLRFDPICWRLPIGPLTGKPSFSALCGTCANIPRLGGCGRSSALTRLCRGSLIDREITGKIGKSALHMAGQSLIAGVVLLMGTLVGIAPLLSDEISASGPLAQTVDFEIGIHSAHFQVIRA